MRLQRLLQTKRDTGMVGKREATDDEANEMRAAGAQARCQVARPVVQPGDGLLNAHLRLFGHPTATA